MVVAGAPVVGIALTWHAVATYPDALRTPGASYLPFGLGIVLCRYAGHTPELAAKREPGAFRSEPT